MPAFTRGARGIELTPAGRAFLDHARVALSQVEAATGAARGAPVCCVKYQDDISPSEIGQGNPLIGDEGRVQPSVFVAIRIAIVSLFLV